MYEAVRQQQSRKMKLICNAVDYVRSPPPNPSIAPSRALHNSPHALLNGGKNITMDERACLDTAPACWPLPLLAGSGCQVPGALALAGGAGSTSVAPARSELACAGCVGVQVCVCVCVCGWWWWGVCPRCPPHAAAAGTLYGRRAVVAGCT